MATRTERSIRVRVGHAPSVGFEVERSAGVVNKQRGRHDRFRVLAGAENGARTAVGHDVVQLFSNVVLNNR